MPLNVNPRIGVLSYRGLSFIEWTVSAGIDSGDVAWNIRGMNDVNAMRGNRWLITSVLCPAGWERMNEAADVLAAAKALIIEQPRRRGRETAPEFTDINTEGTLVVTPAARGTGITIGQTSDLVVRNSSVSSTSSGIQIPAPETEHVEESSEVILSDCLAYLDRYPLETPPTLEEVVLTTRQQRWRNSPAVRATQQVAHQQPPVPPAALRRPEFGDVLADMMRRRPRNRGT